MHPKALLSTTLLESTSDPLFSSSLDLSSRSSEGHLDSHDCNLANFNPATPELNVSEDIENRLSVARENCVTFQTELKRIRDEKHNLWLRNQEIPSDNSNLEPKGKDAHVNQDYVTHTVVLQTLTHANKLIENLDIKGMIEMLQTQIKRNEELQQIIDNKNAFIHDLQINIQSLTVLTKQLCPDVEQVKKKEDMTCDDIMWSKPKPKKTNKHTFPPTWQSISNPNRYECLDDSSDQGNTPDDSHNTMDVQMQNVKLQRQVQFLQKRVAESRPNTAKTSTNVNDPQKHPAATETRVISEATKRKSQTNSNEKKSLDRSEESKRKTVTIMGDSMISYQDEKLHTNRRRIVKVRSYPGATSDDLIDFCKPIARRHPDVIIVHVGTNDLRHREEKEIAQNIMKIKETIKEISPNTKTLISLIIQRFDNKSLNDKACIVNHELMQLISKHDLIDNSNLDRDCIGHKGLHLNQTGTRHLARNFKQALHCL